MCGGTVEWRVDLLVNRVADFPIIFVMCGGTVDQEVDPPLPCCGSPVYIRYMKYPVDERILLARKTASSRA
jgi:hypothetical protein